MKKKVFFKVLTGSVLLLCGCNSKNLTADLSPYHGVWANADCESVQTDIHTFLS
jgi:hypothetical protein